MTKELSKRIITSILLFLLAIFCIFINWKIYIIIVLIISSITLSEINHMIYCITKRVDNWQWMIFNFISISYIFFTFLPSAAGLYALGPIFIFYVLSICICSDIGGFIIGKTIGGKKLTKISPNKTISGSIGSFCFSILPLLLFYNFDQSKYSYSINNFLLCLEISLVCQLGDLFISYLKRKAKVKDTGNILPGHGGLLDRIDGIIFVIPFVQIYLMGFSGYIDAWTDAISRQ